MPTTSIPNYSFSQAINCFLDDKRECYEGHLHNELKKIWQLPDKTPGFLVPLKALGVSTATTGGFLVGTTIPTVADALRPASLALQSGAQLIEIKPDVRVPEIPTGSTAYWLAESESCPESDVAVAALNLSPRRLGAWLTVSKTLLTQAPTIANAVLTRDLRAAIGSALDLAIFSGIGGAEPIGLLNSPTVQTQTFGGSPSRSHLCDFELSLGLENACDLEAMWVTSPAARKKWRTTVNDSTAGSGFLWNDADTVLGRPAKATNNVSDDRAILGNFSDLLVLSWGILEIVDQYTSKKSNQVEVYVQMLADAGPLHAKSFCVSTDSAAQ